MPFGALALTARGSSRSARSMDQGLDVTRTQPFRPYGMTEDPRNHAVTIHLRTSIQDEEANIGRRSDGLVQIDRELARGGDRGGDVDP